MDEHVTALAQHVPLSVAGWQGATAQYVLAGLYLLAVFSLPSIDRYL